MFYDLYFWFLRQLGYKVARNTNAIFVYAREGYQVKTFVLDRDGRYKGVVYDKKPGPPPVWVEEEMRMIEASTKALKERRMAKECRAYPGSCYACAMLEKKEI